MLERVPLQEAVVEWDALSLHTMRHGWLKRLMSAKYMDIELDRTGSSEYLEYVQAFQHWPFFAGFVGKQLGHLFEPLKHYRIRHPALGNQHFVALSIAIIVSDSFLAHTFLSHLMKVNHRLEHVGTYSPLRMALYIPLCDVAECVNTWELL